ncbi:helix-turn-helix domain-containing protein [Streptomyces sp. NPDC088252]|uniref:helix-turn-helix domain-containing protein n=2 Tax=Streptomyces TaxID=1883 RepID=UPI00382992FA
MLPRPTSRDCSHSAATRSLSNPGCAREGAARRVRLRWLHSQRVEYAKQLLESTDLPVDEVAARSGLGSPANFRIHFKRATRVAPLAYRKSFGTPACAAARVHRGAHNSSEHTGPGNMGR